MTMRIMDKLVLVIAPMALLAGCATPETRLRNGLVDAGLPQGIAVCMADRMVDRLSLQQLRRLASMGSLGDKPLRELSTEQFLRKVRALKDPEILGVTTSSAVVCAFS